MVYVSNWTRMGSGRLHRKLHPCYLHSVVGKSCGGEVPTFGLWLASSDDMELHVGLDEGEARLIYSRLGYLLAEHDKRKVSGDVATVEPIGSESEP